MKRKYSSKSKKEIELVKERIKTLFNQAEKQFDKKPELSHRYVQLARKLAMKVKYRLPPSYRRKYCKHCYCYLVPNKNCRVRIRDNKVVYSCLECKKFMRFPYK